MAMIRYDLRKTTSFINTIYLPYGELNQTNELGIIFCPEPDSHLIPVLGRNNSFVFYLEYLSIKGVWRFSHGSSNFYQYMKANKSFEINFEQKIEILTRTLDSREKYFGNFDYKCNINIACTIKEDGNCVSNKDFVVILDIRTNQVKSKNGNRIKNRNAHFFDMIFPGANGLISFNPTSYHDLIFYTIKTTPHLMLISETVRDIFSTISMSHRVALVDLISDDISKLENTKSRESYADIYKSFEKDDNTYYKKKMQYFKDGVNKIFADNNRCLRCDPRNVNAECTFISELIDRSLGDLAYEMATVYHRMTNFSKERNRLYEKFNSHSYIKLCRVYHNYCVEERFPCGKKIPIFGVTKFIRSLSKNNDMYNLKMALVKRSELFQYAYELYKESEANGAKPRFNIKYNYYPFKIFSPALFVMEHLLGLQKKRR